MHISKLFQNKGILVLINKLLKTITKNGLHEYQILRSSAKEKAAYLFELLEPYDTGHELIRIGSKHDGGYLIPNDLKGIKYCFSPGVGDSIEFEKDLSNFGIASFLADPTVSHPIETTDKIKFEQLAITPASGDLIKLKIFNSQKEEIFSGTSLSDWVNGKFENEIQDFILQMDIEGGEYGVILATPNNLLNRFRIICIELHSIPNIQHPYFLENVFIPFMEKLTQTFDVVHLHPNNVAKSINFFNYYIPHAIEITLIRKDRRKKIPTKLKEWEHHLDSKTLENLPPVKFKLK